MSIAILIPLLLAADPSADSLRDALTFHASFDGKADADVARGDGRMYSTSPGKPNADKPGSGKPNADKPGMHRKDVTFIKKGKYGGALRFSKKSKTTIYFRAEKNVAYAKDKFDGTVSFWLSLDPEKDLEPGFCDPIQITDKKWNDAALWVDFSKENPREFRFGAFCDHKVWNSTGRKFDDLPENERPMLPVKKPPFDHGKWTHVVFTYDKFNAKSGVGTARIYMNGKLRGEMNRRQIYTWDPEKTRIMLGLSYIGLFDDLSIFDRALMPKEIKTLYELDGGVKSLTKKS